MLKKLLMNQNSIWVTIWNWCIVICFLVLIFYFSLNKIGITFQFSSLIAYQTRIIQGFWMTIVIGLFALLFSVLFGMIGAYFLLSPILMFKNLASIYVTCIRGTPLMMQIYLFYYILGTAWGIENRIVAGIIILSVFEGAYITEIIRGAYLSLDESQILACKAVGFTTWQSFRFVIFPQMVARILPALTGQFASIIKDSSLLSIISVIELTQTFREISADNFKLFECYLFLGILYLSLTLPIGWISKWLERKMGHEN